MLLDECLCIFVCKQHSLKSWSFTFFCMLHKFTTKRCKTNYPCLNYPKRPQRRLPNSPAIFVSLPQTILLKISNLPITELTIGFLANTLTTDFGLKMTYAKLFYIRQFLTVLIITINRLVTVLYSPELKRSDF